MAPASHDTVGSILRHQQGDLLRRWVEAYRGSPLRMPHPVDPRALSRLVSPILESLADALGPSQGRHTDEALDPGQAPVSALLPGSTLAREVEKAAALVGALHATGHATGPNGYDVVALFHALRDLFAAVFEGEERAALVRFAEWLSAVACDSFSAARVQAERERWREQLEDGTPVVLAAPELPVALLVGRPDGVLLDSVLSRLLLQVVRVGARAAVIDASGMADPARPEVLEALARFLAHRKISGSVSLVAVGLADQAEEAWGDAARQSGTELAFEAHFDRALDRALRVAGYRLVKT